MHSPDAECDGRAAHSPMTRLTAITPVSDEDTNALPVKALEPAIAFYRAVLGFSLTRRDASRALLSRDNVQIGLIVDADHSPGRAGSVAIAVDDLESMHRELEQAGGEPGDFGVDEWGGQSHRTFFLREAENGYCYCFFK